ncbi:nucleoside 2-deoxyribosyltransferase [Hafnia phage Enc34]|uniref:Nucleoside 2-deoxyribosyltransferase n=1 Tax=Hafnia phage Enc34 TaxID=1150990 RepID=H6WYJ8_9CAUD|nr:nucleoside 2-deoxyribosyltransferase [Hafnia phage Enc34]AFB84053.1 hypothetical protein [Hafnia phage Enc34]
MSKPFLLYIAGPYSPYTDENGVTFTTAFHIQMATRMAVEVVKRFGLRTVYPVTPHLNTAHFEQLPDLKDVRQKYWLDSTLELMKRCDGVLLTHSDAYKVSQGTWVEWTTAESMAGFPMFSTLDELEAYLNERGIPDLQLIPPQR